MNRTLLMVAACAAAVAGCQPASQQTGDPFLFRSRVPPPATGEIAPGVVPYGAAPAATPGYSVPSGSAPVYQGPNTVVPTTPGTQYAPPGGFSSSPIAPTSAVAPATSTSGTLYGPLVPVARPGARSTIYPSQPGTQGTSMLPGPTAQQAYDHSDVRSLANTVLPPAGDDRTIGLPQTVALEQVVAGAGAPSQEQPVADNVKTITLGGVESDSAANSRSADLTSASDAELADELSSFATDESTPHDATLAEPSTASLLANSAAPPLRPQPGTDFPAARISKRSDELLGQAASSPRPTAQPSATSRSSLKLVSAPSGAADSWRAGSSADNERMLGIAETTRPSSAQATTTAAAATRKVQLTSYTDGGKNLHAGLSGLFRPTPAVQTAAYTEEVATPAQSGVTLAVAEAPAQSLAPYAYDPDYRWLRGRLEHSQATGGWKLRYIPIDGTTDRFGGSVELDGDASLAGYRSGEFVTVEGKLDSASPHAGRFAPLYHAAAIRRLAD